MEKYKKSGELYLVQFGEFDVLDKKTTGTEIKDSKR